MGGSCRGGVWGGFGGGGGMRRGGGGGGGVGGGGVGVWGCKSGGGRGGGGVVGASRMWIGFERVWIVRRWRRLGFYFMPGLETEKKRLYSALSITGI